MAQLEPTGATREIAAELDGKGVRAVRVIYPDLHGVARGKDLTSDAFGELAEGVNFCAAVMATDLRQTPVVERDERFADMVARPDAATIRVVPWQPEVAWCIADLWRPDGQARWPACPRGALLRIAESFAELGYTPVAGPELEFFLIERAPDGKWRRYVDELSRSYTVGSVSDPRGLVLEMLTACRDLGLLAVLAHHEFSNSQYEITIGHSSAVDAADRGFLLKTAVKEMAARAGLTATFMGKPFNDQDGSGFHLHVSLDGPDGANAFADDDAVDGLNGVAKSFVAGVIAHAPALMAVLAPTVNAYKRMLAGGLVATHANWGYDNRTAFIRVPHERGAGARVELRAGDGSANVHLVVAALLAAGLDGLKRDLQAPAPIDGSSHEVDDPGPALPRSLGSALDALVADDALVGALGAELVETFVRMKRFEVSRFESWVSDWEVDEYASHL